MQTGIEAMRTEFTKQEHIVLESMHGYAQKGADGHYSFDGALFIAVQYKYQWEEYPSKEVLTGILESLKEKGIVTSFTFDKDDNTVVVFSDDGFADVRDYLQERKKRNRFMTEMINFGDVYAIEVTKEGYKSCCGCVSSYPVFKTLKITRRGNEYEGYKWEGTVSISDSCIMEKVNDWTNEDVLQFINEKEKVYDTISVKTKSHI